MRANFVGRSVVSAMTHTPASGPLGPVTTPPMALPSIRTAPPAPCWALSVLAAPAQITAIAITATPRYGSRLILMALLLSSHPTIERALPTGKPRAERHRDGMIPQGLRVRDARNRRCRTASFVASCVPSASDTGLVAARTRSVG